MISTSTFRIIFHCWERSLSLDEVMLILKRQNIPEKITREQVKEILDSIEGEDDDD